MITTEALTAALGGSDRLARLEAMYRRARPRRVRWRTGILTADEIFRQEAKDSGFSDDEVALFIDCVNLRSTP